MEKIIGLLKSSSTSLSHNFCNQQSHLATLAYQNPESSATAQKTRMLSLETLPAEIIHHIFGYLPDFALARASKTSHILQAYAYNELLWMRLVQENFPSASRPSSPSPAKSWRKLYIAHHPYWFLLRHKIWFSDRRDVGDLIVARYNNEDGSIRAFRLLARHGLHTSHVWGHDADIYIHHFKPEMRLWVDDPAIKLDFNGENNASSRLQEEISMQTVSQPYV